MPGSQKNARQRTGNARAPPVFRTGGAIEANMDNDTAQILIYQQAHEYTFEQQQAQEDMLLDIQRESDQTNRDPLTGKLLLAPIGGGSDGVTQPPSPMHLYDPGEQDKEQEGDPAGRTSQALAVFSASSAFDLAKLHKKSL
jgi:hypothetical protein